MAQLNKLNELEGLRGITSFGVLISHGMGAGIVPINIRSGDLHMLALSGITDGFFCVMIFWIMSAVALSSRCLGEQTSRRADEQTSRRAYLIKACIKRYPRLAIPALASALVAYALILTGAIDIHGKREWIPESSIEQTFLFREQPSPADPFVDGLIVSFYGGWRENLQGTSPVLWTMGPELKGSFLVFLLLYIFRKHSFRIVATAAIGAASIFLLKGLWVAAFAAGLLISHIVHINSVNTTVSGRIAGSPYRHFLPLLFLMAIFLVGLNYENNLKMGDFFGRMIYFTASSMIVFSVIFSPMLKRIFASRALVWLGKISFGLYLIHLPVIYSTGFMIRNITHTRDSGLLLWLPLLIVTIQSIAMAYLMTLWVDANAQKISNAFAEFIFRKTRWLKAS